MAEYRNLANPDPQWVDFPNNLPPGTKHYGMNRNKFPISPDPKLDIEELQVPVRDGRSITARFYRQAGRSQPFPVFVYMHGGGYVTGSLETDDSSCRAIALKISIAVLSLEYRLAPENKFPVGFQDCHDALKWTCSAEGRQRLNLDLSKGFLLGGTSAGANFTAGISHLVRDEGLEYPLTGLMFLAGSFCHPDARPKKYIDRILSVDEINDAPGLTRKAIDFFAEKYGAPPFDKRLSPLLFESHAGLAKRAFFVVCGWDPRRDEALLFSELLQEAGMQTRVEVYPGLPHGFWTTCPDLPVSKKWEIDVIHGIRWLMEA